MNTPNGLSEVLQALKLESAQELCLHLPLRYEDKTRLVPLAALREGDKVLVEGEVFSIEVAQQRRKQLKILLREGATSFLILRWLNFRASWLSGITKGQRLRAYGVVRRGHDGFEIVHPTLSTQITKPLELSLTPIYSTVEKMPEARVRYWVLKSWSQYKASWSELLPASWLERLNMPALPDALGYLHQPPPDALTDKLQDRTDSAWQRIKLDELIAQHIALKRLALERKTLQAISLAHPQELAGALLAALPFQLTAGQQSVVETLWSDLAKDQPMHCLLQGDVGSGKTIVAIMAALSALAAGYPVAFMAPTDILATQIAEKAKCWLEPLGIKIILLTGSLGVKAKREALQKAALGEAIFWIGTHALFQEKVHVPRLALVIIDEQHRFGVQQRLALKHKGGEVGEEIVASEISTLQPHTLMMSATPIPRTLAMSYYADLDVVTLTERPAQRQPITTCRVAMDRRHEVIDKVRRTAEAGQQIFWVCPLIEASEVLDLQAAQDTYEELAAVLAPLRVSLLHGRMSGAEKSSIMERMRAGEVDILIATTVIEVGIDIPNATLMVIEHAERFGLAQLHQLRGRVGRGSLPSTCVLLYANPLSQSAKARLAALHDHDDGFEIARQDLKIRGPGELLGARQSGVPMLRYADLTEDIELIEIASKIANRLLKDHSDIADKYLERWVGWRSVLAYA
ncbi:MAG: ATP-dependent DNA helicase RecG [Pseudomonadota bacterium]